MKAGVIAIVAGTALGFASAASAQSLNGTANSKINSSGADTGTNGTLHSTTNRALNGPGATGSTKGSINGTTNSGLGSAGAATGTNGTAHSTANRALNKH